MMKRRQGKRETKVCGGGANIDVELLLALRGSDDADTPSPASLIHAERASHSDPGLCVCPKNLPFGETKSGRREKYRPGKQ